MLTKVSRKLQKQTRETNWEITGEVIRQDSIPLKKEKKDYLQSLA